MGDEEMVPEEMAMDTELSGTEESMSGYDVPSLDEAAMTPENQPDMDEEMSVDGAGMMGEEVDVGMVDLNEEVQPVPDDLAEDEPGTMVEAPEGMEDPEPIEPRLDLPEGVRLVPAPEGLMDPSTLETHPLSEFMPIKTDREYAALKESIEINGLQTPLTRFEGKILDGRHRLRACAELGISVAVMDFVGSADDALIHALSANQYHHEISKTQRATTAVRLLPEVSEMVSQGRLEKVCAAWERKRDGGCLPILANNLETEDSPTSARAIVAAMMQVSSGYVGDALRVQRQAPELFERMHAGTLTLPEALRKLDGESDDPERQQIKASRTHLNRILHHLGRHPNFLERWQAFLSQFPEPPA